MIEATLRSTPLVSAFNAIVTNPKHAMQGNLYIAFDDSKEAIELVVGKGVYGIIYQGGLIPTDDEIAWIEVNDIRLAELQLLRFHLLAQDTEVLFTDPYTLEYIDQLNQDPDTTVFVDEIETMTHKLWKLSHIKRLVTLESDALFTLFPTAKPIVFAPVVSISKTFSALESTTLFDNETLRQKLPMVLQNAFNNALSFVDKTYLTHIPKLQFINAFDVININNFLERKEFGKSAKTLIFLKDEYFIEIFTKSVQKLSPWIKIVLFLQETLTNIGYNDAIFYKDDADLRTLLQTSSFDYALIPFQTREIVPKITPTQLSLFSQGLF